MDNSSKGRAQTEYGGKTPVIPALGSLGRRFYKLKANLGYVM